MLLYERDGDIHFGAQAQVEVFTDKSILITIEGNGEKVLMTMHRDEASMLLQSLQTVMDNGAERMGYVWSVLPKSVQHMTPPTQADQEVKL